MKASFWFAATSLVSCGAWLGANPPCPAPQPLPVPAVPFGYYPTQWRPYPTMIVEPEVRIILPVVPPDLPNPSPTPVLPKKVEPPPKLEPPKLIPEKLQPPKLDQPKEPRKLQSPPPEPKVRILPPQGVETKPEIILPTDLLPDGRPILLPNSAPAGPSRMDPPKVESMQSMKLEPPPIEIKVETMLKFEPELDEKKAPVPDLMADFRSPMPKASPPVKGVPETGAPIVTPTSKLSWQ